MTDTAVVAAHTPTGLTRDQVQQLSEDDVATLAGWHATKAGDDSGRPWWPWAIRSMPLETRLRLASDPLADAAWEKREHQLVVASPEYLIDRYGHVQDPEGPPIPFRMWPEQRDVLDDFLTFLRVVVLKARQLGLTWLALHYACWLLAFNVDTPRARVLALSKKEDDAKVLLARARRILQLLPPFLRPTESPRTAPPSEARGEIELVGRGSMRSLVSDPAAARMETVTLLLWDEAAFARNQSGGAIWTGALGTMGNTGRAVVISTGNGPEDIEADGQAFAQLFMKAYTGQDQETRAVFLPDSVHPSRNDAWRATRRGQFLTDAEFEQEHPQTVDQAIQGDVSSRAYSLAGIAAALRLGAHYDQLLDAGSIQPPAAGGWLRTGSDFGESTHGVVIWPLEGGGLYVPLEVIGGGAHGLTVREFALAMCRALDDCQWIGGTPNRSAGERWPLAGVAWYDSAGVESNRSFREAVEQNVELYPADKYPDRTEQMAATRSLDVWDPRRTARGSRLLTRGVPFGAPSDKTRGGSLKQLMVDYLRWLLRRTELGERVGVLAIGAGAPVFTAQLRAMTVKDDKIVKGNDHGHDAFLAGSLPTVAAFHGITVYDEPDAETEAAA